MNSTLSPRNGSSLLTFGFALFTVLKLADYFSYGRNISDLLSAIAFALLAYGLFKNGGRDKPSSPGEPFDRVAHWGMIMGLVIGLGTLVAKHIA